MTKSKKMVSLLLTAMLMVSTLAVNASAATVTGSTGYKATVTKGNVYNTVHRLGTLKADHVVNGSSEVVYTGNVYYASPYFEPKAFVGNYSKGLNDAFLAEGFNYQVIYSKSAQTIRVPIAAVTGTYIAAVKYESAGGSFKVTIDSVTLQSGSFAEAPRKITTGAVKID